LHGIALEFEFEFEFEQFTSGPLTGTRSARRAHERGFSRPRSAACSRSGPVRAAARAGYEEWTRPASLRAISADADGASRGIVERSRLRANDNSQGLRDRFEACAAPKFSDVELEVILAGAICAAIDFGALLK
jgi:hypothetical protein